MPKDPYEVAIDQILEGAEGDVRLALRTVLLQNLELEARLQTLIARYNIREASEAPRGSEFN
jgi:hypothetical protein